MRQKVFQPLFAFILKPYDNIPRSSHKNKNRRPARAFFRTIRLRTLNRNGT